MFNKRVKPIESQAELEKNKRRLLSLLREKCLFRGDFLLASGKKSDFYLDTRLITLSPEGSFLISQIFYFYLNSFYENKENFVLAGPCTGANPIVSGVSLLSYLYYPDQPDKQLRAAYIRKSSKKHGRAKLVEGPIQEGERVVLFEDVITTGGSSIQAIQALQTEINAEVISLICLVQRDPSSSKLIEEQTNLRNISAIFSLPEILKNG